MLTSSSDQLVGTDVACPCPVFRGKDKPLPLRVTHQKRTGGFRTRPYEMVSRVKAQ